MTESSTGSQPTHKAQTRLRNSCDFCTRSKLKCDQEKPACNRCAFRRQPCVYSRVRKVGRPPRASRNGDETGQNQSGNKRIRLSSPVPASQDTQHELVRPTVDASTMNSPKIRTPPLTTESATDAEGADLTHEFAPFRESHIENTSISQDIGLLDSLELNLDDHLDNIRFDTFGGFHIPTPSSAWDNTVYDMIENTANNVLEDPTEKRNPSVTVQHDGGLSPNPELVDSTLSGCEQEAALPLPGCDASESHTRQSYEYVKTRPETAQAQIQASRSLVRPDFLSQSPREPRCRCTVLLSQLEDSFSHQSFYFSLQGSEIPLDLMLRLEESIQRTHESIFNCRVLREMLRRMSEMDSLSGSPQPNSMLEVGRIMTPDIMYSLEHLLELSVVLMRTHARQKIADPKLVFFPSCFDRSVCSNLPVGLVHDMLSTIRCEDDLGWTSYALVTADA
ncbi:hypothetical protein FDECE_7312 [Fusarium decemcellulare]|nr:hypothetical protein FDECE_7312 [Fusarium decemcellulare]